MVNDLEVIHWTWLLMCPNTHSTTLRNGPYDANGSRCVHIFRSLLYFTRFVKRGILLENEPLSIKARNDLGLN